jgi:hypothetical protein
MSLGLARVASFGPFVGVGVVVCTFAFARGQGG